MHTLGADLRKHCPVRFFHQDRIESIGATDQERARAHRIRYARRDLRAGVGIARQPRIRAGHSIEWKDEDDNATAVNSASNLLAGDSSPGSYSAKAGILYGMPEFLVT